jgi:hypothetical protein
MAAPGHKARIKDENTAMDHPLPVNSRQELPAKPNVRPRPAMFRALGHAEPPQQVVVAGQTYEKLRVFKHDSWAATALYENAAGEKAICKFNRRQGIGPINMRWVGWFLARNESRILQRLEDTGRVPVILGPVAINGKVHSTAIARKFVEGHPLGHREQVHAEFFPRLRTLLDTMHQRGLAYVDLHKRENVLVGDDGEPYLIDFQISYANFAGFLGRLPTSKLILKVLQKSDDYHLEKLRRKSLPPEQAEALPVHRPWWIRVHRGVAMPYRQMRRRMFVLMKVRSGQGRVHSEHFTEEALRDEVG